MGNDPSRRSTGQAGGFALGRQMTVEFYDCDSRILADAGAMEKIFLDSARLSGATIIDSRFHQFAPQGVSGVIVISESHFAVHAWPEHEYAAVDLFTCGEGVNFDKAIEVIASGMGCREWVISSLVNRGIVGNNGLERMVPVVENRDCRAFQLSWKSRYEQTNAEALSCSIDICECKAPDFGTPEFISNFIKVFTASAGFEPKGDLQQTGNEKWCDFVQLLENGRLTGSVRKNERSLYLDLFIKGFFDPRAAAEKAVSILGGTYYRMQPQVRN
ncbi:MAG: adenosylmethionine decarboxylase [Lentisphaeria bacterium]|nr:adenosylmethionine decarboxylase [Lentisphaeria bacterium]